MSTSFSLKRKSSFFGAAMFLRPTVPSLRAEAWDYPLEKTITLARQNPDQWECLLMKRNYLDYAWDHIGGNSEIDEFPLQTMVREVFEETGWKAHRHAEVCRQWKEGFLKGFVYVVVPTESRFMEDLPPRVPCEEVQTVQYFTLTHILQSPHFTPPVKGRVKAFIEGQADFNL